MATTMTSAQARALALIVEAVIDAVKTAGPTGAPGGVLYAAMMSFGCTLQQFESLMSMLVRTDVLKRDGQCYQLTNAMIGKVTGFQV